MHSADECIRRAGEVGSPLRLRDSILVREGRRHNARSLEDQLRGAAAAGSASERQLAAGDAACSQLSALPGTGGLSVALRPLSQQDAALVDALHTAQPSCCHLDPAILRSAADVQESMQASTGARVAEAQEAQLPQTPAAPAGTRPLMLPNPFVELSPVESVKSMRSPAEATRHTSDSIPRTLPMAMPSSAPARSPLELPIKPLTSSPASSPTAAQMSRAAELCPGTSCEQLSSSLPGVGGAGAGACPTTPPGHVSTPAAYSSAGSESYEPPGTVPATNMRPLVTPLNESNNAQRPVLVRT